MADDAGFAVAVTLRERLLNDAVLIAYSGDAFPRSLAHDLPDGPPNASIDVFLAPPRVACKANDTLLLDISMWGSLLWTLMACSPARSTRS
jgi:hypothetical protein